MVYEPRIRSEHLEAYYAKRFDEIDPKLLPEVKELAERLKAESAKDAREVLSRKDKEEEA